MKKCVWGILLGVAVFGGWLFSSWQDTTRSALSETSEISAEQVKQVVPLEIWEGGWITGIEGENSYTEKMKSGFAYGEVKQFLTFEIDVVLEGEGAAFVAAGEQGEDGFVGSMWFVEQDGASLMVEQYVCMTDKKLQYKEIDQKRFIFFNYIKEDRDCGRVFLCQNGEVKEILKDIHGKKIVDSNGTIVCMFAAEDERCLVETDDDTGEIQCVWEGYTEKPYILHCYTDGGIREVAADIVSEEELLASSYGECIVKKTGELYPDGIKQYIVRENGEVNVNIAVEEEGEEGKEILFFYLTFQAEDPEQEPKAGKGCYLLHMTGEKSWQMFLESFSGKEGFLPEGISVLPWYFDRDQIYEKFGRKVNFEGKELWKEKGIVGDVFIPEEELLERLSGLVMDYSENWGNSYYSQEFYNRDRISGSEEERELYRSVKLLGKSDSFLLYITNDDSTILLKTADNSYLWADLPFLFRPDMQLFEGDFDQDGKTELVILAKNRWSASGVWIEHLYIADKDSNRVWKLYELQSDWYGKELEKHYEVEYIDGLMNMKVDGEVVGVPVDVSKEEHYLGCSTDASSEFQVKNGEIELSAELKGFGSAHYSLGGNGIRMKIAYLGAGEWKAKGCCYYSSGLESYITYDVLLSMEKVKEVKKIQYDPMLINKCVTTKEALIPVTAVVVSEQGEEVLMKMDVRYEKAEEKEENSEGKFVLDNLEEIES